MLVLAAVVVVVVGGGAVELLLVADLRLLGGFSWLACFFATCLALICVQNSTHQQKIRFESSNNAKWC